MYGFDKDILCIVLKRSRGKERVAGKERKQKWKRGRGELQRRKKGREEADEKKGGRGLDDSSNAQEIAKSHHAKTLHPKSQEDSQFDPHVGFFGVQLSEWGKMSMCDAKRTLLANALLDMQ
ncbi:hypothetical protein HYC85_027585 [Camellia sinensis]|uniref:Uncharacterized protein n=1 Tax=Camellia sinensis TaxID=4442 RepID=A0A7J7GAU6_CAMSI|nr:hypothetical protein HYC85_027585 [Camellia sinensis]